jgi:uncharacterized protein (DUF342 family)
MSKFDSIEVTTSNVMQEFTRISRKEKIPLDQLMLSIQDVFTYEKNAKTNGDWILLDKGIVKKLDDPEQAQDETVELRQDYLLRIFVKTDEYKTQFDDLDTVLSANKQLTKISFTIKAPFTLKNSPTFERDFVNFINRKKLKHNIFINVWEVGFKTKIKELFEEIQKTGEIKFNKDWTIEISHGFEATQTVNDQLQLLYKNKVDELKEDEYGNIDHSQKGFVITVDEGDVVIRYRKAKAGKIGRNCRGKIIKVPEPVEKNKPDFRVTENIEINEDENNINYIAKKTGSIVFKNDRYDIEEKVEVQALSFKDTGSVNAGIDTDVELVVKETNFVKDAVGTGVNVIASHLNIDGNVGESSKITAHDVKIGGQTHQSSHIIAEEAEIHIHKGHLLSEFAKIERLEAGVVEAEKVQIDVAVGGEIRAREIRIKELDSNTHIYASKSIVIEKIEGSENIVVIDLEGYRDGINEIQETRHLLVTTEQDISRLDKEITLMDIDASESKHALLQIQKRLKKYQQNKIEAPKSLLDSLERHKNTRETYTELKKELQKKTAKLERLKAKNEEFQTQLLDAKIEVRDSWKGHNRIKFKSVDPAITLDMIVNENTLENVYKLEKIKYEKDSYEIVSSLVDIETLKNGDKENQKEESSGSDNTNSDKIADSKK